MLKWPECSRATSDSLANPGLWDRKLIYELPPPTLRFFVFVPVPVQFSSLPFPVL